MLGLSVRKGQAPGVGEGVGGVGGAGGAGGVGGVGGPGVGATQSHAPQTTPALYKHCRCPPLSVQGFQHWLEMDLEQHWVSFGTSQKNSYLGILQGFW